MVMLAKGLSKQLAPYIRVNCIAPGYVDTALGPASDGFTNQQIAERIYLGRIAEPVDIAWAALFLASDAARHVTGSIYSVDGGGFKK